MTLTPCTGQPGLIQCRTCDRLRETAAMRPVQRLTDCAMYVGPAQPGRAFLLAAAATPARRLTVTPPATGARP